MVEIAPFLFDPMYFKNYNEDLGFAEYIVSTGHLTPRASSVSSSSSPGLNGGNSSAFCAFMRFEDFMARDCKIERKINTPKVTQDWITCAAGFHSRGCDVYVNTTILKTHMDLLIRESLCRQEKKKDFLNSLLTNGGGDVTSEESEEFTEYTSASLPTQKASSKNSEYTSTEDTQNIGQTFGSGGDVDVAPIVEVPLTDPPVPEVKLTPTNSVSRTEDDLKEMLVAGLDSGEQSSVSKTTSSYQPTVAANLPQAADTTDGSAGFNSGGDVADITSD